VLELRQTFALFRFVPLAQPGKKYANSGPGFSNPAHREMVRQTSSRTRFSLLDEDSLIGDLTQTVLYGRGLYIGKYPPQGGGKISADVILGKKYEKGKRKRGKINRKRKKGERK
jgi:hypothetical protein